MHETHTLQADILGPMLYQLVKSIHQYIDRQKTSNYFDNLLIAIISGPDETQGCLDW